MSSNRIFLYYTVSILYWFSMYTYVPLLSPYIRSLGGSLSMTGLVIGSYGLSQMVFRIPLGVLSDRVGRRKPFLIAGIVAGTLSSLGFALSSSILSALLFRVMAGMAGSVWVIFTVLYASYYNDNDAPQAMGILTFYTSIGQIVATAAGGVVAQTFGWHGAFWLSAIGGMIALILSVGIKDYMPQGNSVVVKFTDLLTVARNRTVVVVSTLAIFSQVIIFSTVFGFTPEAAVHLGADKAEVSWLTLLTIVSNALASRLGGGLLSNWLGERKVIVMGFSISTVFTAMIPFAHSLLLLFTTQFVNGFGLGLCLPLLMGVAIKRIEPQQRATAMGFFQAVNSLGIFGGPMLAGLAGNLLSFQDSFLIIAAVSLAAVILTLLLTPPQSEQHEKAVF